jgi:hypothetical protein
VFGAIVLALIAAATLAAQSSASKPAGVAGNWDVAISMQDGTLPATMALAQDG